MNVVIEWAKPSAFVPSPMNPRTSIEEAGIAQLRDSLREQGFRAELSHLMVRKTAGKKLEIICGERRWRAAVAESLDSIPYVLVEMTDREVLELQLIENLQRQDLSPIQEAEGYQRLLSLPEAEGQPVHTPASIATRIGRSPRHVQDRLSLLGLKGTAAGKAIEEGKITASHGRLLARVPSELVREEILQKVLHPSYGPGPMAVAEVEKMIKIDYTIELRGARFDPSDAALVPEMKSTVDGSRVMGGACDDCPHNSRNVEGSRSQIPMCCNTECFRAKQTAAYQRWREKIQEDGSGRTTLGPVDNEAAWDHTGVVLAFRSPFVELSSQPDPTDLRAGVASGAVKPWKQLIRGQGALVTVALDARGKERELVEHDAAVKAAMLNGHDIFRATAAPKALTQIDDTDVPPKENPKSDDYDPEARVKRLEREAAEREREREMRAAEMEAVVAASASEKLPLGIWPLVIRSLLVAVDANSECGDVAALHGWNPDAPENRKKTAREWLTERADNLPLPWQIAQAVELMLFLHDRSDRHEAVEAWASALKVDLKSVREKVRKLRAAAAGSPEAESE